MANAIFNIALGRVNELHDRVVSNDPTNSALIIVLLKVAEVDATLKDYDTLALLLAGANTEANFTNYARKTLTNTELSASTVNDATDVRYADMPDQTWTAAGGTTDNTLVKLLVCYDSDTTAGTDANIIPLAHFDFTLTTDGSDILAQVHASGYYVAS